MKDERYCIKRRQIKKLNFVKENKMSVIRINKTSNYTVISNYHFKEKEMSLKAKGLLSLMLSLPEDWNYTIDGLVSLCKENETAIISTLKELKEFGYLKVDKLMPDQTKSGKIEYVYNIFEQPCLQDLEKQDLENQGLENQGLENLGLENQGLENQGQLNTNNKINYNCNLYTNNKKESITSNTKEKEKHRYGEYGRILLTDNQYENLIKEYGKEKVDIQIQKLDEYIQSNDNKNKYKDFNLVLRKSIRENWFNNNIRNSKNYKPNNKTSDEDLGGAF